jgi:hypothetical protein
MGRSEIIRKAVEFGRPNGFVTFDQLNELLPSITTAPEDIEATWRRSVTKG